MGRDGQTPVARKQSPVVILSSPELLPFDPVGHPPQLISPRSEDKKEDFLRAAGAALVSVPIGLAPVAAAAEQLEPPDFHHCHRAAEGSARVLALDLSS
jgi:hypothetical protein